MHEGAFDFEAQTVIGDLAALTGTGNGPAAYYLDFSRPARIPDQLDQQVTAAELTTVRNDVYGDNHYGSAESDLLQLVGVAPWEEAELDRLQFQPTPGARTDYWYAASSSSQLQILFWETDPGASRTMFRVLSPLYAQRPDGVISNDWNRGPLVPSPAGVETDVIADLGPTDVACSACRQGDIGYLHLDPAGDSDPAHHALSTQGWFDTQGTNSFGLEGDPASTDVQFWRDGVLAFGGGRVGSRARPEDLPLPMLPEAAKYELNWLTTRYDDPSNPNLPNSVDTDWAFSSAPDAPASLPAGIQCTPDSSQGCTPLPLLFVNYDLPVDHENAAPAGQPFHVGFTISPQQGAPLPSDISATVSVSYDDGATWSDPQSAVAGEGGEFGLTIQHPASGSDGTGYVSLRVTATDGAGDSVRQTVIRAYALTAEPGE